MDKYILFEPNSFLHLSWKAFLQEFCGGWSAFIFGTQQQGCWAAFLGASARVQS